MQSVIIIIVFPFFWDVNDMLCVPTSFIGFRSERAIFICKLKSSQHHHHPFSSLILTISGAGGGSTEAVCTLSFAMRLLSFQFFNGSLIITRWGLKENGWLWWKRFYYAVHTCLVSLISHSWALTKSKWKKY